MLLGIFAELCALFLLPFATGKIIKRSDGVEAHIQRRWEFCVVTLTTQAGDPECEGDSLGAAWQNGTGLNECTPATGECAEIWAAVGEEDLNCWLILYDTDDCSGDFNEYECGNEGNTYADDFGSVHVQCD